MRRQRSSFRPQLESLENRLCPSGTTVLPISAFLSHQGTTDVFTGPGVPDQLGWSDSVYDPGVNNNPHLFELVDYTGLEAQYLVQHGGPNLHTQVTGFVTETPTNVVDPATGRFFMEVSVNLETTNALTWAVNTASETSSSPSDANIFAPRELGYTVKDLLANPKLTPALSTIDFQVTFQEDVGQPLPDLAASENETGAPFDYVPPAGFTPEIFDVQSWGTGTLAATNDLGPNGSALPAGQNALIYTSQLASLANPNLPGTNNPNPADGFFQEPIDIVPVASASTRVAYMQSIGPNTPGTTGPVGTRGTLFVLDQSNGNDNITVAPTPGGGAKLASNLGNGTYPLVTSVVVGLGGGNNNVQIGSLPRAIETVTTLDGNNNITIGDSAELVVHVGAGNNNIVTGNTIFAAQFICVDGGGNNNIVTVNNSPSVILVAGNGNNNIAAAGTGDFIEMLGDGSNNITDTGIDDMIWLGGDGHDNIDNYGLGSVIDILAANPLGGKGGGQGQGHS